MSKAQFWEVDQRLARVTRHPEWAAFHRAAGQQGVFFAVDREGTRAWPEKYSAVAIRYTERPDGKVFSRDLARVDGDCPLRVTIDAFHAARAAGHGVDAGIVVPLEALLAPQSDPVLVEFGL